MRESRVGCRVARSVGFLSVPFCSVFLLIFSFDVVGVVEYYGDADKGKGECNC